MIGASGAVWIDGDNNKQRTTDYSYAKNLVNDSNGDISRLMKNLASYDEAVAVQAAALLAEQGWSLTGSKITAALKQAEPATKTGFRNFIREWKQAQTNLSYTPW